MTEALVTPSIRAVHSVGATFDVVPSALPERHRDFWNKFSEWEPWNQRALRAFVTSESVVFDIGAWVGPISLLSAALGAKKVFAFEPDPDAYRMLEKNVRANLEFKD